MNRSIQCRNRLLLTPAGIPLETFHYRLGNRSALEWVIDQYQVKEGKRSGIRSDPNRADDEEYIVRLVGQVVRVTLLVGRIGNPSHAGSSTNTLIAHESIRP